MPGIIDYPAFAAAVLVFLMLPGPGTFAVLASAAQGGLRGGYASLAGIIVGDLMLVVFALAGVAALMQAQPALFRAVQYLGAAYMAWIGLQLLLRRPGNVDGSLLLRIDHRRCFRQTFLITLINPKAIVFYMAFFPLFIDPQHFEGASTFALMVATIMALTLAYGSLLVLAGDGLARSVGRHPRLASIGSKLAGIGLVYFGWRITTD